MELKFINIKNLRVAQIAILSNVISFLICFELNAQYDKNPVLQIEDYGYSMVVEKMVEIPDDNGGRPRINSFTYFQDRLFTNTEQGGKIYEIIKNNDNEYEAVEFFDVKIAIPLNTGRNLEASGNWHTGLRCVAFHPEFLSNGKFYTAVMENRPADTAGHTYLSDVPNPIGADGTLIEWTYDFTENKVDENSYREVFRVGMPVFDHTIKEMGFNRYAEPGDEDYGLLYVTHGDGSVQSAITGGGTNNDALGKILRINPLADGDKSFSIPPTNPFINDDNWIDAIYAVGFRNPHSICFAKDSLGSVHIISGNAGRDNIEEINVVAKGQNYGWSDREGTYVHLAGGGTTSGISALPSDDIQYGYTYPAAQYSHTANLIKNYSAISIVGGFVYTIAETGEKIYLSSDFPESGYIFHSNLNRLVNAVTKLEEGSFNIPEDLTQAPLGLLNVYVENDNNPQTLPTAKTSMRDVINDESSYDGSNRSDIRFGQDGDENMYILNKRNGWIYKILSILPHAPTITPTGFTANAGSISSEISIYPNPVSAQGVLNIHFENTINVNLEVKIYSSTGSLVSTKILLPSQNHYAINLNDLDTGPGCYFIRISADKILAVEPIIIF